MLDNLMDFLWPLGHILKEKKKKNISTFNPKYPKAFAYIQKDLLNSY